jgi:hypothetical protein
VAGSVAVDSPQADSSGAGVAVAGSSLSFMVFADLMKSSQVHHYKSKGAEVHYEARHKLTAQTSL